MGEKEIKAKQSESVVQVETAWLLHRGSAFLNDHLGRVLGHYYLV